MPLAPKMPKPPALVFLYKTMAYRKKYKKRAFKRKSAKRRGKRTSIKKLIRREISRNVESKTQQFFNFDGRLYIPGNASFPTDNIFPLGIDPGAIVVNQGIGQGQRVGNRIKTKRLMFKGTLVPQPFITTLNVAPQPVQLKIYIFYDKSIPTQVPNPVAANDFFQNGNTAATFQNDLVDLWRPINTDRYRILATKTFKLGNSEYNGTGTSAAYHSFTNNDFKYNANFSFNLTKHYPRNVKFNDATAVPITRGLFCMIQYVAASGAALTNSQYLVGIQYMLTYDYEDA